MKKFGFIAHPMNKEEYQFLKFINHTQNFFQLDSEFPMMDRFAKQFSSFGKFVGNSSNGVVFYELDNLVSASGDSVSGIITYLPMMPEEILADQNNSFEEVLRICHDLIDKHVDIIGLGGFTGILGKRGVDFQKQLSIPVTTGNIFTAYNAIAALDLVVDKLDLRIENEAIVIIGFPGSIGGLIARYLSKRSKQKQKLILVGRGSKKYLEKFVVDCTEFGNNIELSSNIIDGLKQGQIIISATSSGNIIEESVLREGSIVIDVAAPRDIIVPKTKRNDVLVIDGGRCSFNKDVIWSDNPITRVIKNNLYGCVLETVLLALENKLEPFSLGRDLEVDKLTTIGEIAKKHGMGVSTLYSYGELVQDSELRTMQKYYTNKSDIALLGIEEALKSSYEETVTRYGNYINPMIADLWKMASYARLFKKAEGMNLWDEKGNKYLDFVGGYGSVNFGHNHPVIVKGINEFVKSGLPSLVQVAPPAITSALSENLAKILPGNLEVSFFCNSGAEAVEAAIKLAKITTGKKIIVSTENSFHGKTIGALSVSGREKYKRPFRPLLKNTIIIPFDDLIALEEVLIEKKVAAFILEPIQGEAGVIIPHDNYLIQVRELCNKYDVLMICDEIQTGFGRTGELFAVNHENVVPDIITLSKSLGGGIAPIGACVTNKKLWESAYGSPDNYALHTSTFGGNNFSAAAAIQATKLLVEDEFSSKAKHKGLYFKEELKKIAENYPFIIEVRGRGLMIGIQFEMIYDGGLQEMSGQIKSYVDEEFLSLIGLLTNRMNRTLNKFTDNILRDTEEFLQQNFLIQISALLLKEYNILTFSTLNNPNVLRIQPPLVITKEEIDYFISSFNRVLEKFNFINKKN